MKPDFALAIAAALAAVVVAYVSGRYGRRNDLMKLAVAAGEEAFRQDRVDRVHAEPLPLSFYIYFHYRFLHLVERDRATPDRIRYLNDEQKLVLDAVRDGPWATAAARTASVTATPVNANLPGASTMDERETATKFYETGIAEFLVRIKQRDTILLFFLGAAGAVGGFSIDNDTRTAFLLFIPYLAGVCGAMMSYQTLFVEALLEHFHRDLREKLGSVVPFELSSSFAARGMRAVMFRTVGNGLSLITPAAISLWMTCAWAEELSSTRALWWVGVAFGVLSPGAFVAWDIKHIRGVKARSQQAK